uniref:Uncharacterized protein n=1 Tax=Arion vulgaris TaxID=1028688 RepID=A0A0B7AW98_9EUPU
MSSKQGGQNIMLRQFSHYCHAQKQITFYSSCNFIKNNNRETWKTSTIRDSHTRYFTERCLIRSR